MRSKKPEFSDGFELEKSITARGIIVRVWVNQGFSLKDFNLNEWIKPVFHGLMEELNLDQLDQGYEGEFIFQPTTQEFLYN